MTNEIILSIFRYQVNKQNTERVIAPISMPPMTFFLFDRQKKMRIIRKRNNTEISPLLPLAIIHKDARTTLNMETNNSNFFMRTLNIAMIYREVTSEREENTLKEKRKRLFVNGPLKCWYRANAGWSDRIGIEQNHR